MTLYKGVFRRRPTGLVEALKRHPGDEEQVREFVGVEKGFETAPGVIQLRSGQRLFCRQLLGDWLVKWEDGRVQSWDSGIFEREFEAVPSDRFTAAIAAAADVATDAYEAAQGVAPPVDDLTPETGKLRDA